MKRLNNFKKNKGLSTIVSTLLILLLVFVAVAILWVVVRNVISQGTEQVSLGKFTLDLKIEKVTVSGNSLSVKVKRNVGAGEFTGLSFIMDDGEDTEIYEIKNLTMDEYQEKTFNVPLTNLISANVKTIEIAPIFTLSSGKEVIGDVKDTWEISGSSPQISECSVAGDCNPNNCQIATCPSGSCVYSDFTSCINDDGLCCGTCTYETDNDCIQCSVDADCSYQDTSELICSDGDVYIRNTNWTCGSGDTCGSSTNNILSEDCDDGNSSTTDTCSNAVCVHTALTCPGSSTQSCTITNGVGQQSRTCTDGVWSNYGSCYVVSCDDNFSPSSDNLSCVASSTTELFSSFETTGEWHLNTFDYNEYVEGSASLFWDQSTEPYSIFKNTETVFDFSEVNYFSLWINNNLANSDEQLIFVFYSVDNPATTDGSDYYYYRIVLNQTGWQNVVLSKDSFFIARSPLGWNQIERVYFSSNGWGQTPNPNRAINLDKFELVY